MKFVCAVLLALIAPAAFGADVTLTPNGREVNINGSSVACVAGSYTGVNGAADDVVIGMAISGRFKDCLATKDAAGYKFIWLRNAGSDWKNVGTYSSDSDTAKALRGYYNAGACN